MKKLLFCCVTLVSSQAFAENNPIKDFQENPVTYCKDYALVIVADHDPNSIVSYIDKSKGYFSSWEYLERKLGVPGNEQQIFNIMPLPNSNMECGDVVPENSRFFIKVKDPMYENYDYLMSYKPNEDTKGRNNKYYYLDNKPVRNFKDYTAAQLNYKVDAATFTFQKSKHHESNDTNGSFYDLINCQDEKANYLDCKDGSWCNSLKEEELKENKLPRLKIYSIPEGANLK
jgi:hypothetical protein